MSTVRQYRATWTDPEGRSCEATAATMAELMADVESWRYGKWDLRFQTRVIAVTKWRAVSTRTALRQAGKGWKAPKKGSLDPFRDLPT